MSKVKSIVTFLNVKKYSKPIGKKVLFFFLMNNIFN